MWMAFVQFFGSSSAIQILYFYQVDKIVHFLGGFMVWGMTYKFPHLFMKDWTARGGSESSSRSLSRLVEYLERWRDKSLNSRAGFSFLLLLAAAVIWEAFEWMVLPDVGDLYRRNYALWRQDTVLDIIIGMVGGWAAFVAYRRRLNLEALN